MRQNYILTFFVFIYTVSFSCAQDSLKVYIFLHEDCPVSQYYTLQLNELAEKYSSETLEFIGLFPNFSSKKPKIEEFKTKYNIQYSLKTDYFKTMTKKLDATITPEVVIYNQTKEVILYQGRVDNNFFRVGKRRTLVTTQDLRDALESIRNGKEITNKKTQAVGCFINFNDATSK